MNEPIGVFDIGSNTVLLTCGKLDETGRLEVLLECHDVARLAQDLEDGGPLHPEAKERVLQTLIRFSQLAQKEGVQKLYAAGTAAFRRASDGPGFAKEIQRTLDIPVKILSGKQEAQFSYLSAQQSFPEAPPPLGMIDIGGGSTELVLGDKDNWFSLPLGTVKLLETFVSHDPISDPEWDSIKKEILGILDLSIKGLKKNPQSWVAVAATPTALATLIQELDTYDPKNIHGFKLKLSELHPLIEKLRTTSLAQRMALRGMQPKRAELLPLGGLILAEVMEFFKIDEIQTSHHGLRYGILWDLLISNAGEISK